MQITIMQPVEVEVGFIVMELPIYHGNEDIPEDFPGRDGDLLTLTVNIDTKEVIGWPDGQSASLCIKVNDGGVYTIQDSEGKEIGNEYRDYVPDCVPNAYGAYVEMEIDENGVVTDWPQLNDKSFTCFFTDN